MTPMARGLDEHKARRDALSALGKDLARRSGRKCELCEVGGQRLDPHEVTPLPEEPHLGQAVLLCAECSHAALSEKKVRLGDLNRWRFLEGVVWSDVAPVQVVAVRLLRRVAGAGAEWAVELEQGLYLSDSVAQWVDGASPAEELFE